MTLPKSNELKDRMKDYKESIDHILEIWGSLPPEKIPINYYSLATEARKVAIFSFLLGDKADALEWFKKSSDFFICNVDSERRRVGLCVSATESGRCFDALNMAVLSGDASLVEKSIKHSLEICMEFPQKYKFAAEGYYIHMALTFYLAGKKNEALGYLDLMNPNRWRGNKGYFCGLKTALAGLANGDKSETINGLNMLLKDHTKNNKEPLSPEEILSIPATVLVKIAIENGIKITPEDIDSKLVKYIPWNLFE